MVNAHPVDFTMMFSRQIEYLFYILKKLVEIKIFKFLVENTKILKAWLYVSNVLTKSSNTVILGITNIFSDSLLNLAKSCQLPWAGYSTSIY